MQIHLQNNLKTFRKLSCFGYTTFSLSEIFSVFIHVKGFYLQIFSFKRFILNGFVRANFYLLSLCHSFVPMKSESECECQDEVKEEA